MPTYVYKCPKCGHEIEMVRTIAEHATKPMCVAEGCDGNQVMETQLGTSVVQFKGSGWTPKFTSSKPRKFKGGDY